MNERFNAPRRTAAGAAVRAGFRRQSAGQAIIEFSLIISLLMLLVFSIIECSWVFHNYAYLDNAVSAAARLGAVGRPSGDISRAVTAAVGGLPIDLPVVTVATSQGAEKPGTDRTSGNLLTVMATIHYPSLTPFAPIVRMANGGQLTASATVRIE